MIFTYFIDRKLKGALRGQFCLNKKINISDNCGKPIVKVSNYKKESL